MSNNPLDRPPGLAPKGTSRGLGLMSAFAPGIPGFTAMAASPWLPGGAENGLVYAAPSIGLWILIMIPLVIGFKLRRHWGVVLYFYTGLFCVVALPICLALLATLYISSLHHEPPDYYYIVFGVGLLAMVPFWPWLIRPLRLKYWQPWTRPDQWEVGDERIADWVFDAAGVARRPPTTSILRPSTPVVKPRPVKARRRR